MYKRLLSGRLQELIKLGKSPVGLSQKWSRSLTGAFYYEVQVTVQMGFRKGGRN